MVWFSESTAIQIGTGAPILEFNLPREKVQSVNRDYYEDKAFIYDIT